MSTMSEREAITHAALDYFEGWFDGDTARIDRALHPALAKRSLGQVASAGADLRDLTKEQMVTWTAAGEGKAEDRGPGRRIDVTVVDVHGNIASAVVDSDVYREYLHLVRTSDGWKIVSKSYRYDLRE